MMSDEIATCRTCSCFTIDESVASYDRLSARVDTAGTCDGFDVPQPTTSDNVCERYSYIGSRDESPTVQLTIFHK